ncbi:MAG TPA: tyrosine-type recombinase/integrase [Chthonomonadaceae bacterium]|nr:tyrosine-type recombinase/integrase [Chthonomonadaceae bacterium]
MASVTWDEAIRAFLTNQKANRAYKTWLQRRTCMTQLADWAKEQGIELDRFGKRHLDEYIAMRRESGLKDKTVYHDGVSAKVFTKYCKLYELLDRDPLAGYVVRNPPNPPMYMPTEDDMRTLLKVAHDYWDISKRKDADRSSANKRAFHRDRNYAILLMLLDTACRSDEVLSLKMDEYRPVELQMTVAKAKGREARAIPLSRPTVDAVTVWEARRRKLMRNVREDEGWLFVTESGGKIEPIVFRMALRHFTRWAGLSDRITQHSLRRYALNRLAKNNIFGAQKIAGHKSGKTTEGYTKIDPEFLRDVHTQTAVVGSLLGSKRAEKRKRMVG